MRFTIALFQLFSDIFVEDPLFLCEIAERRVSQEVSDEKTRISTKEKNKKMIKNVSRLMEVYSTLAFANTRFITFFTYMLLQNVTGF